MSNIMQIDAITGETVFRDMTSDELTQHKLDLALSAAQALKEKTAQAKAAADKAALLAKLGITADEAALLLG